MTEPRGYRRYLSHVIVACAAVALFAAWSKRDALAAWWNRPSATAVAPVAPVINMPVPQVSVEAPPELLFEDKTHEYEIDGKRAVNLAVYRCGLMKYNVVGEPESRGGWFLPWKRLRAKAAGAEVSEQ